MLNRDDVELTRAMERCELPKAGFPHASHLRVAWVYLTGWANGNGVVNFRDDVYGIDTVGTGAEARVDPALMPSH